jgi:collagenase-like PrtC family protease
MKKIELMAPAGSMATLKATVSSGADSVYFGLQRFSARASATNFNEQYLKEAIRICKANDVKTRLTMNTLVKNHELTGFFEEMENAYCNGIDAVIIQDAAFIPLIRKSFPDLKVHISTQAGVMNTLHVNLLAADRINLARELTEDEIRTIRKNCRSELEMFIHGALCVSISGSCLMSSFLGGRSGNRGRCAQPCRKDYDGKPQLSLKDLCLIHEIPRIIKTGIDSLKIEGRMRTPYYVATTTSVYRKAIDSYYGGSFEVTQKMMADLRSAFNRDFTNGAFAGNAEFSRTGTGTETPLKREYLARSKPYQCTRKSRFSMPTFSESSTGKRLLVRTYSPEDALAAEKAGADIVYFDLVDKRFPVVKETLSVPVFGATPRIMLDQDVPIIRMAIDRNRPDGILACNPGAVGFGLTTHLDYSLNTFNDLDIGKHFPVLSPELSLREISGFHNKSFGVFVHGRLRLMTLRHEITTKQIEDRRARFNVDQIRNGVEITNQKELGLFSKSAELLKRGINNFFVDTDVHVGDVVSYYRKVLDGQKPDDARLKKEFVLGWYYRGVQ